MAAGLEPGKAAGGTRFHGKPRPTLEKGGQEDGEAAGTATKADGTYMGGAARGIPPGKKPEGGPPMDAEFTAADRGTFAGSNLRSRGWAWGRWKSGRLVIVREARLHWNVRIREGGIPGHDMQEGKDSFPLLGSPFCQGRTSG